MAKSCYYSDVIFMDTYICFYGAKQRAKRLNKDIKIISFTNKSVIEKLQFCWNSGNANLNFNFDVIAVLRLAPMTSL